MNQTWSMRIYEEGDEDKIYGLTKTIWGAQVPEKERWMKGWRWMHHDNPAGKSIIWLAEIKEELVGQYPLIKENMKVGKNIIKGAQIIDTMTHPDYRRRGIAYNLGKKALKELEKENIQLVYAFPNQQAYPLHIKSNWIDLFAFQMMIKPLNLKKIVQHYFFRNKLTSNVFTFGANPIIKIFYKSEKCHDANMYKIKKLTNFDEEINKFWNKVSNDYTIITKRDKKFLNWRYVNVPNANYSIYVAKELDEIYGYIIFRCKNEGSLMVGYIYDIIALTDKPNIVQFLIAKAVEYLRMKKVDAILCKMGPNEIYRKGFLKNGFIPHSRFKGRFIVYRASTKISENTIKKTDNWYIQSGDLPSVY